MLPSTSAPDKKGANRTPVAPQGSKTQNPTAVGDVLAASPPDASVRQVHRKGHREMSGLQVWVMKQRLAGLQGGQGAATRRWMSIRVMNEAALSR